MLCHNGSTIPGTTGRLFFLMIVVVCFFLSSSFVVWLFFVCGVLWCVGFSGCSSCCGSFVVTTVVFI